MVINSYEYLERRKCILDLQIVGIGDRLFGGSVCDLQQGIDILLLSHHHSFKQILHVSKTNQ